MANPYRHREISAQALLDMTNVECYAVESKIVDDLTNIQR